MLGRWVIAGVLALAPLAASAASNAPRELYGKSVIVSWTEGRHQKFPDGHTNLRVVHAGFTIYISDAGRAFVRSGRNMVNARGQTINVSGRSKAPDGDVIKTANTRYKPNGSWSGQTYVSTVNYESGARRITVIFDPGFASCRLDLTHGKEDGAPGIVLHGMGGQLYMLTAIDIASPTCTVRAGNALAE